MIINDTRQRMRHTVPRAVEVDDMMAGNMLGHVGNISETGMLLIASAPLVEDALYQLQIKAVSNGMPNVSIDIGAHLLWMGPANTPGLYWSGLRFLTLSYEHRLALNRWMATLNT
jgi:hypothetical protein